MIFALKSLAGLKQRLTNRSFISVGLLIFFVCTSCDMFAGGTPEVPKTDPKVPGVPAEDPYTPTNEPNRLGMNTWYLNDWDGSNAFVDLMKHGRPWKDADWTNDIPADANGWPTQDSSTVLFAGDNVKASDFNGLYKVSFEGQADVSALWVDAVVSNKQYDSNANITTCDLTYSVSDKATGGIVFRNTKRTASSANNTGITNIRIIRPGYPTDGTKVFTDAFVNAFQDIGLIRPMEWLTINANSLVSWSERTKPGYAFAAAPLAPFQVNYPNPLKLEGLAAGVALEYIIRLCNEAGSDLWINIPTLANDEYVSNLAKLILYGSDGVNPYSSSQTNPVYPPLKSSLKVYVEFSNEIWNTAWGFRSFYLIQDYISRLPSGHPIFSGGLTLTSDYDRHTALCRYTAYRLGKISELFQQVFGSNEMISRIRPILATQRGNANETLSIALLWADEYYRKQQGIELNTLFYGAGGNAYYAVKEASSNIEEFLDPDNYPDVNFKRFNQIDSTWAYNYGLKRVAYEGGLGLDVLKTDGTELLTKLQQQQINDDPRVQDLVEKTHIAWAQTGGDILVYYCLTGPESWKFANNLSQLDSPKMKGLRNIFASKKAAVTMGGALPGTLVARELYPEDYTRIRTGYGWDEVIGDSPVVSGNKTGNMFALAAHSGKNFTGQLTLRGQGELGVGASLGIWINGKKQGVTSLPGTAGLQNTSVMTVTVPEGAVVLRIEVESGSYSLHSVNITE